MSPKGRPEGEYRSAKHEGSPVNTLSLRTLADLPPAVVRPAFDPARVTVGIVHLGLGAFHRAHQAVYTDDVLARDPRWGICGVCAQDAARDRAAGGAGRPVHGARRRAATARSARVIGSVRETRFAGADRAGLVARIADPRIAHRHADRHREGLLPRSGHRRAEPRASGHRARPRASGRAGIRGRHARRRARRAPGARTPDRSRSSVLRQPAAQRPDGRRRSSRDFARRVGPGARGAGSRPTSRSRARWSTASCRRRPTPTSRKPQRAARRARRRAGRGRGLWAVGDRGSLRRRAPGVGGRRRAVRRRCRAVRDDEAAAAQRQPFHARLSRLPDGSRFRLAGGSRSRCWPRSSSG